MGASVFGTDSLLSTMLLQRLRMDPEGQTVASREPMQENPAIQSMCRSIYPMCCQWLACARGCRTFSRLRSREDNALTMPIASSRFYKHAGSAVNDQIASAAGRGWVAAANHRSSETYRGAPSGTRGSSALVVARRVRQMDERTHGWMDSADGACNATMWHMMQQHVCTCHDRV